MNGDYQDLSFQEEKEEIHWKALNNQNN